MSYYNTTNLKGEDLKSSVEKTVSQEEKVLSHFKSVEKATASETWEAAFDTSKTPLTSVRRAITNLTKEDKLVKTDTLKEKGMYGKPEYYWIFKKEK